MYGAVAVLGAGDGNVGSPLLNSKLASSLAALGWRPETISRAFLAFGRDFGLGSIIFVI